MLLCIWIVQVSGEPLFVAGNATVIGDITFGNQVGIWFGAVIRADRDRIVIGDRSNIQDNCVVHTSKGFPVIIGNDVSVGHGQSCMDAQFRTGYWSAWEQLCSTVRGSVTVPSSAQVQ